MSDSGSAGVVLLTGDGCGCGRLIAVQTDAVAMACDVTDPAASGSVDFTVARFGTPAP